MGIEEANLGRVLKLRHLELRQFSELSKLLRAKFLRVRLTETSL